MNYEVKTCCVHSFRLRPKHKGISPTKKHKPLPDFGVPSIKFVKETLDKLHGPRNGHSTAPSLTDSELESIQLASQAFLWAFPLVVTAPNFVQNGFGATPLNMNKLLYQPTPINASVSSAITFPNVNVLYSSAFLDLTQGPVQISVPNTNGRYCECLSGSVQVRKEDLSIVLPVWMGGRAILGNGY